MSSPQAPEGSAIIRPILQMRSLSLRESNLLKSHSQHVEPTVQSPNPSLTLGIPWTELNSFCVSDVPHSVWCMLGNNNCGPSE